jgi:hypothetical protein
MLRIKSNTRAINKTGLSLLCGALALLLIGLSAAAGLCAEVSPETARRVAEAKLLHHIALYDSWNGHPNPVVADAQPLRYQDQVVAYNFTIEPSGHILVAVDDDFSPILLYSASSRFEPERANDPIAIESWIMPELAHNLSKIRTIRNSGQRALALSQEQTQITAAWRFYTEAALEDSSSGLSLSKNTVRTASVGPLLATIWGQHAPYNLGAPNDGCADGHSLTGCVATAWAQVLRYWRWPQSGTGSKSYVWNSQTGGEQVLEVDFSSVYYDWDNMPAELTTGSSEAQKDAVSLLMYHMGVAAEMQYGCDESVEGSASDLYADEVLAVYFRYNPAIEQQHRAGRTATQWFNLFKTEFEAEPPRPVILSIFTIDSGHEVVADGYQDDSTNLIHINFGWDGNYNGFYNITSSFTAGATWSANSQVAVVKIAPVHIEIESNPNPTFARKSGGGGSSGGCFITTLH